MLVFSRKKKDSGTGSSICREVENIVGPHHGTSGLSQILEGSNSCSEFWHEFLKENLCFYSTCLFIGNPLFFLLSLLLTTGIDSHKLN